MSPQTEGFWEFFLFFELDHCFCFVCYLVNWLFYSGSFVGLVVVVDILDVSLLSFVCCTRSSFCNIFKAGAVAPSFYSKKLPRKYIIKFKQSTLSQVYVLDNLLHWPKINTAYPL